jgi:hypothetical protein
MSRFDDFVDAVTSQVPALARDTLGAMPQEAVDDARAFLSFAEDSLRTWTGQLESGELEPGDFRDLASDLPQLAQLAALSRIGIAEAALQRFRDGLIDLVINAAIGAFVP